jgi:hypothetical protein
LQSIIIAASKNFSQHSETNPHLQNKQKKMSTELFLDNLVRENAGTENIYYDHFMNKNGGSANFNLKRIQPRIGQIYSQSAQFQRGYGNIGRCFHNKKGSGIGSVLSSLFTRALPFIKKGAKALGSAAADVASNVVSDVIQGKNVKESAIEQLKNKGQEILQDIPSNIKGILKKTDEQIPQEISPPKDLAAPTPTKFRRVAGTKRRLPPKQLGVIATKQRKTKYPALKRFE